MERSFFMDRVGGGRCLQHLGAGFVRKVKLSDCWNRRSAQAPALARHQQLVKKTAVKRRCAACDGEILIDFQDGSHGGVAFPRQRRIFFPRYQNSGHPVTLSMPEKFLNDVKRWMH